MPLKQVSTTGNPKSWSYAFALRTGLKYPKTVVLNQEIEAIYKPMVQAAEEERLKKWQKKYATENGGRLRSDSNKTQNEQAGGSLISDRLKNGKSRIFLRSRWRTAEQIADQDGLRQFFLDASADLGFIHESAYEKFWHLLLLLQEQDDPIAPDRDIERADAGVYSLKRISRTYFHMNVPTGKKTSGYDYQKAIKKNWPGRH